MSADGVSYSAWRMNLSRVCQRGTTSNRPLIAMGVAPLTLCETPMRLAPHQTPHCHVGLFHDCARRGGIIFHVIHSLVDLTDDVL